MIGVTTGVILDKRNLRKDDTYAVKLRVTHKRQQQYYPINVFLTVEDWEKTQQKNPRKGYKEDKFYFNEIEQRAIDIIKKLHPFSFTSFERKFNQDSELQKDALILIENYIIFLRYEERFGTAQSYNDALKSFKNFLKTQKRKKIMVWNITPEWLKKYEKWMTEMGRSPTTIGFYLRNLRAIINMAIENGSLDKEEYPFGKRKYQIPSSKNIKKALKIIDIKKIVNYKPSNEYEAKARDLWLFSYLSNGLNVKDIANLQYKNIKDNKIAFIRAKTKNTTKHEQRKITVPINAEIKKIIKKWGIKNTNPDTYIFGIINNDDNLEKQYWKIKQATKIINKHMKHIGEELEITVKITTYTARHSFATVLKRSGAPIEFISESLGHKDLKTTENYLDSFEDDVKEAYQKKLLDF